MSEVEMLYLLRVVSKHIEELERRLEKNRRYFSNPNDEVLYYKKVVVLEDEYEKMVSVRNQIKAQVATAELYKALYQEFMQK